MKPYLDHRELSRFTSQFFVLDLTASLNQPTNQTLKPRTKPNQTDQPLQPANPAA
jgi:hypothetical protein